MDEGSGTALAEAPSLLCTTQALKSTPAVRALIDFLVGYLTERRFRGSGVTPLNVQRLTG